MSIKDSLHEVLVSLEQRGWEALSRSDGAKFYADIMSDDAVMIFPGMVLTKQESITAVSEAPLG